MNKHSKPVQGNGLKVSWEPLGQISPEDLPEASGMYPGPWSTQERGNGHVDVFDAEGRYFAHVYCYNREDSVILQEKVAASKEKFQ